jgi:hypothetical protein
MTAGQYFIVGGYFDMQGKLTTDTVNGVTIFLTGNNTVGYAQINLNAQTATSIVAATSGTYKGIAIFQDRNAPVINSGSPNTFNGGSNLNITGAIYIPKQLIKYNGGNTTTGTCTRIVAYMIDFNGGAGMNTDCSYGFGQSQSFPPVLVE